MEECSNGFDGQEFWKNIFTVSNIFFDRIKNFFDRTKNFF